MIACAGHTGQCPRHLLLSSRLVQQMEIEIMGTRFNIMQRRRFLKWTSLLGATGLISPKSLLAGHTLSSADEKTVGNDREYWVWLINKMASPILSNISKGELRKNMRVEYSPRWDGRDKQVAYMEAFGRLIAGMAPWFALPEESTDEGRIRKRLYEQTLRGIANGFDPQSPDYFYWGSADSRQPLVDAAFIAHAFVRAPRALWEPLSDDTKRQVVHEFSTLRQIKPGENNWLLFAAMIESFLLTVGAEINASRIDNAIDKMNDWYLGDGCYGDGKEFHFDHYNSYVIQPMLIDVLRINADKGRRTKKEYDTALRRMKRYAQIQERYISPEGTYPVIGRSSTYRTGAFQALAQIALQDELTEELVPAQVRCALTAVMKRMFIPSTFTPEGWLELGLIGSRQSGIADSYSNTGSMYMASLAFLPLGLPATHRFWSAPFTDWTSRKAWESLPFNIDHALEG